LKTKPRLADLALFFLKLGAVGFGGPSALIAMMEIEMVQKKKWVTRKHFMDLLAVTYLIPGPNAAEMAHFLGSSTAGFWGLITSGISLILPPTLITILFAYSYQRLGNLPDFQIILASITPMIIAVILYSGYRIGQSALKDIQTVIIFIVSFLAASSGMDGVIITLSAGLLGLLLYHLGKKKVVPLILISANFIQIQQLTILLNDRKVQIFLYFLKIGAILFGSGHVLFAYINHDVVNRFHWLTSRQLLDAIAVGQITPGPVSSAVTFIGYLLEGLPGAILATIGIFLPSFIIVLFIQQFLPKIIKISGVQIFFDGINAGVVALIFAVALNLMRTSIIDISSAFFLILSLVILIKYKIDPALLVLSGALIGIIKIILT
jgi:chromate transporter